MQEVIIHILGSFFAIKNILFGLSNKNVVLNKFHNIELRN